MRINFAVFAGSNVSWDPGNGLTGSTTQTRAGFFSTQYDFDIDFNDVRGQLNIKRALEIAACGFHSLLIL